MPAKNRHYALKFAAPEAMPELLVEAVTLMLAAGEPASGIVRCVGLVDCSAALPPDRDMELYTKVFLMRLLKRIPKHLARGAGCLVLELHDDSLFYAISKHALACITCQAGYFAVPVKLRVRSAPQCCAEPTCMYALRRRHNPCLSAVERAAWAHQFFTALRFVHGSLRVYHRDLKPPNLLVSGVGVRARLVITDFGRVQSADAAEHNWLLERHARALTDAATCLGSRVPPRAACMDTAYALRA